MNVFPGGLARARELLTRYWGYPSFRVPQLRVLGPLLTGRSVLSVLPTGAGKSLCYQIPALMANGLSVVVSPLISLMQDQVGALRRYGIAAAYVNSALPKETRRLVLEATLAARVRLLYCAPERLSSLVGRLRAAGIRPALLAVDEAHCITEWGNEFRPVYRQLGRWRYVTLAYALCYIGTTIVLPYLVLVYGAFIAKWGAPPILANLTLANWTNQLLAA